MFELSLHGILKFHSILSEELAMPLYIFILPLFKTFAIFPYWNDWFYPTQLVQSNSVWFSLVQSNQKQLSLHISLSGTMLGFWECKKKKMNKT